MWHVRSLPLLVVDWLAGARPYLSAVTCACSVSLLHVLREGDGGSLAQREQRGMRVGNGRLLAPRLSTR